jgi:hypothetical protein
LEIKETVNMSVELHQSAAEAHPNDSVDGIEDVLVEAIWHGLGRQLSRERVRCVVAEIATGFQDARVKTFVPILVRRRAIDRLKHEMNGIASQENDSLDDQ